jgi:nicotinamide mononucleotide transporter
MSNRIRKLSGNKAWKFIDRYWMILIFLAAVIFSALNWTGIFQFSVLISGLLCVVLAAKGNILNYPVGMYNSGAYAYIAFQNGLFGEVLLNLGFYIPTNIIGFFMWRKWMNHNVVQMKKMTAKGILLTGIVLAASTAALGFLLMLIPGQKTPFIDASTNTLSVFATILMMKRYREQWILYIILNILTIVMWSIRYQNGSEAGATMIILWSSYLANAIYGYIKWSIGAAEEGVAA